MTGPRLPRARTVGLSLLLAAAAGGCAARGGRRSVLTPDPSDTAALVWPAAPETARVRWLASLGRPADIGAGKSLLRRVVELVAGSAEHAVRQPYGLAVDSAGRIYVADGAAHGVHVFDPERRRYRFLRAIGRTALAWPVGVAVTADGALYVADAQLGALLALGANGRELFRPVRGLARPAGLALDRRRGLLYVVETQAHRVAVFDTAGARRRTVGTRGVAPGELNFPTNAAVDADGRLYITDTMNFRVQCFAADGSFLGAFGRPGDAVGDLARPKGLGLDSEGHVYVVEGLYDVVNVFDRDGRLLLGFGGAGHGRGEFWLATGLAVDAQDRIYVADSFNARVQVFQYLRPAR